MADTLLFLTELVGLKVFDLKGRKIGTLKDAAVVPLVDSRRVDRFLVGGGWSWLTIRHDQISKISLEGIHLKDEHLTPYHSDEYMLRLVRDLLDQQIIDAQGRKVVRVTDVTFEIRRENSHDTLTVVEVDVGVRAIFRRLVQGVIPPLWVRRMQGRIPPHSISWDFCNILEPDPQRRLRLNISNRLLEEMHPADLADIVEDLSPDDREAIFENIDSEVAADTLSEVDPDIQASILESLETETAAAIIEEMSPVHAADALSELEEETSEEILEEMDVEPKAEVRELLEFDDDTAGGMMNTQYVTLHENAVVADAMLALKGHEHLLESLNTLFLIGPNEKFVATVPVARLFAAGGLTPLRELAIDTPITVTVEDDEETVTELFDKYNLLTLPVLEEGGRLAGIITADDVISVLRRK